MAEIRNVNIDKEFIVKFGVCRTNFSDDMLSISLEVLPEAIKEVLQETIVEDGEITVTPVKHGRGLASVILKRLSRWTVKLTAYSLAMTISMIIKLKGEC